MDKYQDLVTEHSFFFSFGFKWNIKASRVFIIIHVYEKFLQSTSQTDWKSFKSKKENYSDTTTIIIIIIKISNTKNTNICRDLTRAIGYAFENPLIIYKV